MQRCPTSSMVSWTSDLCSNQSVCEDITWVAQQYSASGWLVPFLHLRSKPPSSHNPCSCKIRQIPLDSKGDLWLDWGNTMEWEIFCPSHKYQLFCMQVSLPPGPRFIFCTQSASSEYVEWPWELSIRNRDDLFFELFGQFETMHYLKKLESCPPVSQKVHQSNILHNSSHIQAAGPHPWASPQLNK